MYFLLYSQGLIDRSLWILARPERDHDRATPQPKAEALQIRHSLPMIILIGIGLVAALASFAVETMSLQILEWIVQ